LKFVHAADLHVDSPLQGLVRYPGAPVQQIRLATRRALTNLVELCEAEGVRLLLLAGDLFDGDWRDYTTGLFFAEQMTRLKRCGVEVVLVRGNHDAASQITKHLSLPDNVAELSHKRPQTRVFEQLGVAVHGQSYARREQLDDLAQNYPDAIAGLLNIGLLHTCVSGRVGHEPYAPCRVQTLLSKGYDYWALGHVHEREVLHEHPWVVFSGNLQGRHIKECGPKGATLVSVEGGEIVGVQHRELDVVRWERCGVELAADDDADHAIDKAFDKLEALSVAVGDRALVVRVVFSGQTRAHAAFDAEPERWVAQLQARVGELDGVWLMDTRFETEAAVELAKLRARHDALGQVARALDDLRADTEQLRQWLEVFSDLRSKLPVEVRQGEAAIRLDDPETLRQALGDVERLLLTRLSSLGDHE